MTRITELRKIIVSAQNEINIIQMSCKHKNKNHDTMPDWEGDYGWECLDCGKLGES